MALLTLCRRQVLGKVHGTWPEDLLWHEGLCVQMSRAESRQCRCQGLRVATHMVLSAAWSHTLVSPLQAENALDQPNLLSIQA